MIHPFDRPPDVDEAELVAIVGGKGAGLARMTALGLPVPPGFTISTEACHATLDKGWPAELDDALHTHLAELEARLDRRLGDPDAPLLVSVRSGAPVSMPGMMDTVLDAGTTATVAEGLERASGGNGFGWDTWRRFLDSYVTIVLQAPDDIVAGARTVAGLDREVTASTVAGYHDALADAGYAIPDDPVEQIRAAAEAVFHSWRSDRAAVYRRLEGIADDLGTAATVQAMVFGNLDDESGTGVAFTRDPATGANELTGDFLPRAQGEDVVAGTHVTFPIQELGQRWPSVDAELRRIADILELDIADMADIEFTVERGQLWLLQTRRGKRSPQAALRVAVEMAEDPDFPLTRAEAVDRVADLLDAPPTRSLDEIDEHAVVVAGGIAASPGTAVGVVCTDVDSAVARAADGEDVILVRPETSPADVHGMSESKGLVTTLGGMVSHAAVVARSWGLPAVVGCDDLTIDEHGVVGVSGRVETGEVITVDGTRGVVLLGEHRGSGDALPELDTLRAWREEISAATAPAAAEPSGTLDADGLLRVLSLKGMATPAIVVESARADDATARALLAELGELGDAKEAAGDRWMLTPEGTEKAEARFRDEAGAAGDQLETLMGRFHELNDGFKQVITAWQTREVDGEQVMNDHTDEGYDAEVLSRLADDVHPGIRALLADAAAALPRLADYTDRLELALAAIDAGDHQMIAHPLKSSYHTVWFELHEELIRLTGRNRADEAAAGRA